MFGIYSKVKIAYLQPKEHLMEFLQFLIGTLFAYFIWATFKQQRFSEYYQFR